jgi:hypothetical protein
MKMLKYSNALKYKKIIHFNQNQISIDYDKPFTKSIMDRGTIIFCDNKQDSLLEKQCKNSNLKYVKLGFGIENWLNTYKPFLFLEWLNNNLSTNNILLFLDAYDVILPQNIDDLINSYIEKDDDKTCFNVEYKSMESNIDGYDFDSINKYEESLCENKKLYLNAGACIGTSLTMFKTYTNITKLIKKLFPDKFENHSYKITEISKSIRQEQPIVKLSNYLNKDNTIDYNNNYFIRMRKGSIII